jgi:hypothetical protein
MLSKSILNLSAGVTETVEISVSRLAELERIAGFGRIAIFIVLAVIVFGMIHIIVKIKVEAAIEKSLESLLKKECDSDVYVRGSYQDGIIYTSIKEQIRESCEPGGDIYYLVKIGKPQISNTYQIEDEDDC